MKGIWNIVNNIIPRVTDYPKYVIDNDNEIHKKDDIANNFKHFFVSVGPHLAEKIPDPVKSDYDLDTHLERNPNSVFLKAADEKEILDRPMDLSLYYHRSLKYWKNIQ